MSGARAASGARLTLQDRVANFVEDVSTIASFCVMSVGAVMNASCRPRGYW